MFPDAEPMARKMKVPAVLGSEGEVPARTETTGMSSLSAMFTVAENAVPRLYLLSKVVRLSTTVSGSGSPRSSSYGVITTGTLTAPMGKVICPGSDA